MKTLFFDLARLTGWAAGDQRGVDGWGTFLLPQTYEITPPYFDAAERAISELIDKYKPALIGFESPLLRNRDNVAKLRKLYGLANEVERIADRRGITCREASLGQIRTHFLGKGYPHGTEEVKTRTKVRCRARGWAVKDDNEADALAGLDYLLSLEIPAKAAAATPLFQSKTSRARGRRIKA